MISKPLEILLVEDNPGDIRLLSDFMKRSKVPNNMNAVENGAQALDYLHKTGKYANAVMPHLIILDLNMPIKGGREVLAEVKEDPALKHIPIIVLTTSDAPFDINNSYLLHANCYLTKPADLDQFYHMVSAIEEFWMTMAKIPKR
jgi:CheY-like chemotaxis protein